MRPPGGAQLQSPSAPAGRSPCSSASSTRRRQEDRVGAQRSRGRVRGAATVTSSTRERHAEPVEVRWWRGVATCSRRRDRGRAGDDAISRGVKGAITSRCWWRRPRSRRRDDDITTAVSRIREGGRTTIPAPPRRPRRSDVGGDPAGRDPGTPAARPRPRPRALGGGQINGRAVSGFCPARDGRRGVGGHRRRRHQRLPRLRAGRRALDRVDLPPPDVVATADLDPRPRA